MQLLQRSNHYHRELYRKGVYQMMLKNLKKIGKSVGSLGLALIITCGGVLAEGNTVKAAEKKFFSVSDISEELVSKDKTMQSYVEGSDSDGHWRYGKTYDSTGKRTLTLAQQYCFNRLTGQGAKWVDDDNTGDVIFNGRGDVKYNNTEYTIDFTNIPEGYHVYRYTPADGTQIPLAGWKNWGKNLAIHQESFDVNKYPVGSDFGLIDPAHYGRWAMYHGVEFHSATGTVPMTAPGEIRSRCYDYTNHRHYRNSTTWWAICAVCGEYVAGRNAGGNTYASRDAVKSLPVLEQGAEYCITCPVCGGIEVTGYFSHNCKAISANRYTVSYNIGTSDPNAAGITNNNVWYYNFANLYENIEVKEQDRTVAECGYTRPGYTFAGWSLSENGAVLFQPGASLLTVQKELNSLDDGASITLYAIWKPNTSYFKVDANTNTYNGGALYNGAQIWTSQETPHQTSDGSSFITSTYTIDRNKITLPKGYTVSFNTDGGSAIQSITAEVIFDEGYEIIKQDNGFFDTSTGTYIFGKETGTADNADIVKLQYFQKPIKLPKPTKGDSGFIGWYTDTSFTNYVGTEGDSYTPTENVTLYARYSTIEINATDVYYKADGGTTTYANVARDTSGKADNSYSTPDSGLAIRNATGAANLSIKVTTSNSYKTVYRPYYRLIDSGEAGWKEITTVDGTSSATPNNYDATFEISKLPSKSYIKSIDNKGTYTYTVQSTGLYKLDAYGAQGGDSSGYTGGFGGEAPKSA